MARVVPLDEILQLAKHLSLPDKVWLIEEVAPQIERELKSTQPAHRTPLGGLWEGNHTTEQDIAEARAEMWGRFPHGDI
ncbi:MAG: hypothetical protein M3014_01490 [Chloroflexota bacterium]|nr:hypothetical protein [Chloroflexota bacterium]